MTGFALRNLVRNRARSALALLGLAGSTAGVVVLVAISVGARRMIAEALSLAQGVMVLEENAPDPLWSRNVPAGLEDTLARVPGVTTVVPEVWHLAFSIEDAAALKRGVTSMSAIIGFDPEKHSRLRKGGVFARALVEGRMFTRADPDGVVISRRLAEEYKKHAGSVLKVLKQRYVVTGVFDTGTRLDNVICVPESRLREIAQISSDKVSNFFLEIAPDANPDEVAERVRPCLPPGIEARSTSQWGRDVNGLVSELDPYLAAVSVVAGAIGALGVVNTMLMSVRERVRELGVLRATGWTKLDVFRLVLVEAALLGAAGGALGAVGGTVAATTVGRLLPIQPQAPPSLALASLGVAVLLGALGGLYPAVYASRLDPIVAIRGGA
jgi:putative ABC transport system permease protein